jgi:large subunit ribosomal protein L21
MRGYLVDFDRGIDSNQNNYRRKHPMYAIIRTGGRQFRVMEGETLRVEKLEGDVGAAVNFEEVLMVGEGDSIHIGAPLVSGASVAATIKSHGRADKIRIIKFRRRKHHMKQMGHRQHYTEIQITGISGAGEKKSGKKAAADKE